MWVCGIGPGAGGDAGKCRRDWVGNGMRTIRAGGGLPPATVLFAARYPGVYRGRGPPLPAGLRAGVGSGGQVAGVVDPSPLPVTIRNRWWFGGGGVGEGRSGGDGGF
jgi:hypothetical protein